MNIFSMVNNENHMMTLLTVFISGAFGLIVAIVTWLLAIKREKSKQKQENLIKDYERLESYFIDCISLHEKIGNYTINDIDYKELFDDISINNAKAYLIASQEIINKLNNISLLTKEWTREYNQGKPKKLGIDNFAIVSSNDREHIEKANEIHKYLSDEIVELIKIMKNELQDLKSKI